MSIETRTRAERPTEDRVLEVRDVSVSYDMERGVASVLDEADLDVQRQEIVGIVGESGSGKSMFASALLNAAPPPGVTTGDITYYPPDGREPIDVLDLDEDELRQFRWEEVAMVFQGAMSSFNPTMRIRQHFEETIEAHDMDLVEQMRHARGLLEDLYLDPDRVMDAYPHELSGGMKQRALIALSLVLEPEVLVMDEPTAALDLLMQRSITKMLSELRDKYDLTILFITHDLPLVSSLTDRLVVMYAFNFIEKGSRDDVLLEAAHPYTRALLNAVPSVDANVEEMSPIEGRSPDPVDVPDGCPYHPRCELATEECREEDPEERTVTEGHEVACFHWEEAREKLPYSLSEDGEAL